MATKNTAISFRGTAGASASSEGLQSTQPLRPNLPCKRDVFPQFCKLAWGYCLAELTRFSAASPRFTALFVQEQLDLVTALEGLSSLEARQGAAKTARQELMVKAQSVRMLAQQLKSYLLYAFPDKEMADTALRAAGLNGYTGSQKNWGDTSGMIKKANEYIAANLGKLMERDNMPSGFQLAFHDAGAAFNTAWASFIAKEKAVSTGTDAVDNAIQQVLVELFPMLELGRRIFIFEPEQRELFTVADLKAQVQGHHRAGVKGRVTEVGSGRLLVGVKVAAMVEGQERMAESDKTGRYVLELPNGVYDLVFSLPGMEPSAVAGRLVQPGVMGRLNVEMRPEPVHSLTVKHTAEPVSTTEMLKGALQGLPVNGTGEV